MHFDTSRSPYEKCPVDYGHFNKVLKYEKQLIVFDSYNVVLQVNRYKTINENIVL